MRVWTKILLVVIAFHSAPLFAGETDKNSDKGTNEKKNKELEAVYYDIAVEAFEEGDYPEAAEYFRKVYALTGKPYVFYNIAHAELSAERYGVALDMFQKYLREAGEGASKTKKVMSLESIEMLRGLTGRLNIRAPSGCEIFVDGVERGKTPVDNQVALFREVSHTVEIKCEGMRAYSSRVTVKQGDVMILTFDETKAEKSLVAAETSADETFGPARENKSAAPKPTPEEQKKRMLLRTHVRKRYFSRDLSIALASMGGAMSMTGGLLYLNDDIDFQPYLLAGAGALFAGAVGAAFSSRYHKKKSLELNRNLPFTSADADTTYNALSKRYKIVGLVTIVCSSLTVFPGLAMIMVKDTGTVFEAGRILAITGLGIFGVTLYPLSGFAYSTAKSIKLHRAKTPQKALDISFTPTIAPYSKGVMLGVGGQF